MRRPSAAKLRAARNRQRILDSHAIACGPVDFDIKMARRQGWSDNAIVRAWEKLYAISLHEARVSHRRGKVPGCLCVECEP